MYTLLDLQCQNDATYYMEETAFSIFVHYASYNFFSFDTTFR